MSNMEAVTRIQAAAQFQGIESAYDVLKTEVELISSTVPANMQTLQKAELAHLLRENNLLPDLAIVFASEERTRIEEDGTFDRSDLRRFKKDANPVEVALTNVLLRDFNVLEAKHVDWFGDELSENDLNNALEDVEGKEYSFGITLDSDGKYQRTEGAGERNLATIVGETVDEWSKVFTRDRQVQEKVAEVKSGDGFDSVARRELMLLQKNVTNSEVIEYSRRIAEYNKMDRDTSILHPGDRLRLPYIESLRTDN